MTTDTTRQAPPKAAPASLSELDALARIYASNYASPHHFTLGVNGLRALLEDATGQALAQDAARTSGNAVLVAADKLAELQQEAARWRFIRTLAPVYYAQLWQRNIEGEGRFDDLVDAARRARTGERG